jgi:hypothetical protein
MERLFLRVDWTVERRFLADPGSSGSPVSHEIGPGSNFSCRPVAAGHRIANLSRIRDTERTDADGSSASAVIESLAFEGRRNPVGRLRRGMILVLPPI